ncbi:MAG: transglutaminase family protein [Candidatus Anammoxibacter sp.]
MKIQKLLAIAMLLSQIVAYSYITNAWKFTAIIFVIALAGILERPSFRLNAGKKYILFVLVAAGVAVMLISSNVNYSPTLAPLFNNFSVHFAVRFFLISQVAGFFLLSKGRIPAIQPLYGLIVMVFTGSLHSGIGQNHVFLICSLGFIISASFFTSFSQPKTTKNSRGLQFPKFRMMVFVFLFLAVAALTWFSGVLIKNMDDIVTQLIKPRDHQSSTGFPDWAKLGTILHKKSRMENTVVLRMFADRNPRYLRAKAYDVYHSPTWKVSSKTKTILPALHETLKLPSVADGKNIFIINESKTDDWNKVHIWSAYSSNKAIFTPLNPGIISASFSNIKINDNDIAISIGLEEEKNYSIYSTTKRSPIIISELSKAQLIRIPANIDAGVVSLSHKIFEGCNDPASKIAAVERYFINEYDYKLGIEVPQDMNPLTYFLLKKPAAHCEYFATGAAVLLRLAGVPCRYVSGFMLTEWNPIGGYWIARNRDAHAWVEAYDEKSGWVIVEATPPAGVPNTPSQGKLICLWDYIKHCYQVIRANLSISGLRRVLSMCISFFTESVYHLFCLIVGLIIILFIFIGFSYRKRFHWRKRKKVDKNPIIDSLHQLLTEMDGRLRKHDFEREPNETINKFANRLSGKNGNDLIEQSSQWYERYANIRYGKNVDAKDVKSLKTEMP